jgi:hypothetical protein
MMHAYAHAMQCNYGAKHLRCYSGLFPDGEFPVAIFNMSPHMENYIQRVRSKLNLIPNGSAYGTIVYLGNLPLLHK